MKARGCLVTAFVVPIGAVMLVLVSVVLAFGIFTETARRAAECAAGTVASRAADIILGGVDYTQDLIDAGRRRIEGVVNEGEDLLERIGIGDGADDPQSELDNLNLSSEQLGVSAMIIGIGVNRGRSERDIIIALMTGFQESNLRNLYYGDRDSLGIFQQRWSQGWGTPEEILDPEYSINKFYSVLETIEKRDQMELWQAAQAVQRSAFPTYYAKWEDESRIILAAMMPEESGVAAIVGDSLTSGMEATLRDQLELEGWTDIRIEGEPSRSANEDRGGPIPGTSVIPLILTEYDVNTWLIDLGTNDANLGPSKVFHRARIDDLMQTIPQEDAVGWITIQLPGNKDDEFNLALKEAASEWGNLSLIPWDEYVASNPSLLAPDGIHYTPQGYRERALFVAEQSTEIRKQMTGQDQSFLRFDNCELGETVISSAIDFAQGQTGLVFDGSGSGVGNTTEAQQGFIEKAFASGGFAWPDDPLSSDDPDIETLTDITTAVQGDVIVWGGVSNNSEIVPSGYGFYLGNQRVIREPNHGEVISIEPIDWDGVVAVLRVNAELEADTNWTPPMFGYSVGSGFGMRMHPILGYLKPHLGVDMSGPNPDVYAAREGTVNNLTQTSGDGRTVWITHQNGAQTRYVHLESFADGLEVGDVVETGEKIGEIGDCSCTNSTGPHLHFAVEVDGSFVDPSVFFAENGVSL